MTLPRPSLEFDTEDMSGLGENLETSAGQLSDDNWLKDWTSLSSSAPTTPLVPAEARHIHTPLIVAQWKEALKDYPNQPLAQFFLKGITEGFRIGYNYGPLSLKSARRNLDCALQHKEVVSEYLQTEITNKRVSGPFMKSNIKNIHISRFGVIPKNQQANKWRLIVDLSHPHGHSVNDGIPKPLCSLSYITVEDATKGIRKLGRDTLMAKIDIKSAFRLLPIHPADRHLLAMEWDDLIYFDHCLPFGLRSAPKLFNILAELLSWIAQANGVTFSIHYLDDFLTLGPPDNPTCSLNLEIFTQVCHRLGVPLALEKVEGPATSLTFLGITLDSHNMEIRLPDVKLERIRNEISAWLTKKSATKRQILSLVGLLQHATKVVRCGRSFVARMYSLAAKLRELTFFTRLTKEFRSDLYWWHLFIHSWNGLSLFHQLGEAKLPRHCIQTDASGAWGCGAVFSKRWFQWSWTAEWSTIGIMAKELAPIVVSCAIWGPILAKHHVLLQCDNNSLVAAINKGYSRDPVVMRLLRCLWFFVAIFDIRIYAEHIAGITNCAADMLSRNNMTQFSLLYPQMCRLPTPIPAPLLDIVAPKGPDWTSPSFGQLFEITMQLVQQQVPGILMPQARSAT